MKNAKLWTMITAVLAILAAVGGFLAAGEEGEAQIHVFMGVVLLISALISAFVASRQ
ncbi:hypothetical protein ABFB09_07760 [Dehalogenimonas sp. THU2]|uniref:hypothetical protein n=1 Tax=Dehalogenimonas sp. THU2 TaxID=3151121 RepID=UPI0032189776